MEIYNNPIVITAMAGVFPGAENVDKFWENILTSKVASTASMSTIWKKDRKEYIGNRSNLKDKTYLDEAFLIDDTPLFSYEQKNRQEYAAKYICSQLTSSLSARNLERTGLVLGLQGAPVSFVEKDSIVSLNGQGYRLEDTIDEVFDVEGQIEYIGAGLGGPKISVDVACASSLYALAHGIAMIESGQAERVVVMGLNLSMPLSIFIGFSHLGALDANKQLRSYLDDAKGTFFGEAVSGIVIERENSALARKAEILGVVAGLGLSSDGADKSIFSPGKKGQELIFERAYKGVNGVPDYLEGHGTATPIGDKVELESMDNFFSNKVPEGTKIPVGAAKSLVGHSLAAAGMTSIIKSLLIIKNKVLPPHIQGKVNDIVTGKCIELLHQPKPIKKSGPVRVGISSLGFGGGNGHLVLEEYLPTFYDSEESNDTCYTFSLDDVEFQLGEINNSQFTTGLDGSKYQLFPSTIEIEAKGLRAGPNFLKKVDAFQLLALDKAHNLFKRNPGLKNSENTAVMMHTNLGGDLFLKVNRRIEALYNPSMAIPANEKHVLASRLSEDFDNDIIASSMPNMCSGYSALHMNTNGFHMTTSGRMSQFFSSLINGLFIAGKQQHALVAGAGHSLKSPLEIKDDSVIREYVAWFLFNHSTSSKPLALVHYFPDSTIEKAIAHLGWKNEEQEQDEHSSKVLVSANISPAEVLIRFLTGSDKKLVLSVGQTSAKGVILLEKQRQLEKTKPERIEWPLEIKFNALRNNLPSTTNDLHLDWKQKIYEEINSNNQAAILRFLKLQRRVVDLIGRHASEKPLAAGKVNREILKTVISRESVDAAGSSANLIVDESHPYFFDHPLDHVPGILLLQGIPELVELEVSTNLPVFNDRDYFISKFNLRFTTICNKTDAISISTKRLELIGDKYCYQGKVVQNNKAVCVFNLEVGTSLTGGELGFIERKNLPDPKLLHKKNKENVIVSTLDRNDSLLTCKVLSPNEDHFFSKGNPYWYSPCFTLEASRQFNMLLAHEIYAVALSRPMHIVSVELNLTTPLFRGQEITLKHQQATLSPEDVSHEVNITIHSGNAKIGTFKNRAILLNEASF